MAWPARPWAHLHPCIVQVDFQGPILPTTETTSNTWHSKTCIEKVTKCNRLASMSPGKRPEHTQCAALNLSTGMDVCTIFLFSQSETSRPRIPAATEAASLYVLINMFFLIQCIWASHPPGCNCPGLRQHTYLYFDRVRPPLIWTPPCVAPSGFVGFLSNWTSVAM
jgi:hypothetical protein